MDTTNIVETMIAQHRDLQKDLGLVAEELKNTKADTGKIDEDLKKFAQDLTKHLTLEDNTFYVELLKKMKDRGQETSSTEEFIAEMGKIGETVMAFLGKFSDSEKIEKQINDFKNEFSAIIDTLNMRVEAEESGVYLYW